MKLSERDAYITLNQIPDIGPVTVQTLAEALGGRVAEILEIEPGRLPAVRGVGPAALERLAAARRQGGLAEAEEKRAEILGLRIVTPVDAGYPEPLRSLHDPPLALYVKGEWKQEDRKAVALVGSRHTTSYGRETAARLAADLARLGYVVVSGLARGIDTWAHRGALEAGGRTVAVLGGGLHDIYPPENRGLAEAIARSGALISEFPIGREPDKTTFPYRNRLISGLSQAVVVVEATRTSGALITARFAADQGRSVLAVPGRVDNPLAQGPHDLIRQGARLVEGVEDILDELGTLFRGAAFSLRCQGKDGGDAGVGSEPLRLLPEERLLLERVSEEERIDVDTLTRRSGLSAAVVAAALLTLEMKGLVRVLPGRVVERRNP